jgi:hypothetical protein
MCVDDGRIGKQSVYRWLRGPDRQRSVPHPRATHQPCCTRPHLSPLPSVGQWL